MSIKEELLNENKNVLELVAYMTYETLTHVISGSSLLKMPGDSSDTIAYSDVISSIISNSIMKQLKNKEAA